MGRYYTLRKAGLLLLQDGIVILNPENQRDDINIFLYETWGFHLDKNQIDHYDFGPKNRE